MSRLAFSLATSHSKRDLLLLRLHLAAAGERMIVGERRNMNAQVLRRVRISDAALLDQLNRLKLELAHVNFLCFSMVCLLLH